MPDAIAAKPGYAVSLRVRKRIEQVFAWERPSGRCARPNAAGFAAYNLVRMRQWLTLAAAPGGGIGRKRREIALSDSHLCTQTQRFGFIGHVGVGRIRKLGDFFNSLLGLMMY